MTFLGIFPLDVKDIIFAWRGACEMDVRWGCSHKVRIPMQGAEWPCEVDAWEWSCEVGMVMQGGNGHMQGDFFGGGREDSIRHAQEVGMVTQGGNGHARWEWPCKVGMVM